LIIDFHTHIFPPDIAEDREAWLASDATFAELYASPKAGLATAGDLLASMDGAGIDVSVALGFAWSDAGTCSHHNDYLLEAAAVGDGRIIPFCTLPLGAGFEAIEAEARRCIAAGAQGFGELRPDNLHFDLSGDDGRRLGRLAHELGAMLLFHVSEPVGHTYPGKQGLDLGAFYAFVRDHAEVEIVGAHWGGGLPFYALMPEVKLAMVHTSVDTAGTSLLYEPGIYGQVTDLLGAEHVLFGSDFPLLSQKRSLGRIQDALPPEVAAMVVGGNAQRLLGLA
jgi:predicted TIM-barrel fold metal-dependent hydrolase